MKKLLQRIALVLTAVATLSVVSLSPVYADTTQAKNDVCAGAGIAGASCGGASGSTGLTSIVGTVINILSVIIGIAAVIMIILAGFKYITSAGDASGVKSAKDTLTYAIVGLVLVALAQTIVRFVLTRA